MCRFPVGEGAKRRRAAERLRGVLEESLERGAFIQEEPSSSVERLSDGEVVGDGSEEEVDANAGGKGNSKLSR